MKGFGLKLWFWGCLSLLASCNICSKENCKNGECISTREGEYQCHCWYGWKGSTCEENIDDCRNNKDPCLNGGTCVDQKNSRYLCNCTAEYIGEKCQFRNPCVSKDQLCQNGGICEPTEDGKYQCKCTKRFIGKSCEKESVKCPDNINDRRESCSNKGECQINQNGELFCKCDLGYSGEFCDKRANIGVEMGCREDYCFNNGLCEKSDNGSPTCKCINGFSGNRCEIKLKELRNTKPINIETTKVPANFGTTIMSKKHETGCDLKCKDLRSNGRCDKQCDVEKCDFDGGDCDPWRKCMNNGLEQCKKVFNDGICNPECNSVDCLFDGGDCFRSMCRFHQMCLSVYQNNICNEECNNPECGFDGGDCQTKRHNSFFGNDGINRCSSQTKVFELDLILMTSMKNFTYSKKDFLQKLSSSLRMVVTVDNVSEINFNHTSALSIKLLVNHTQCILYGGQCFSSLDQISNFLNASIEKGNVLSLPFKVAKVDTRIISKPHHQDIYLTTVILGAMGLGLIITFTLVAVLLRDKWGKLRTKIRSTGIWTPSDGYSTSTSSINSGSKSEVLRTVQMEDFNKNCKIPNKFIYSDNNFKIHHDKHNQINSKSNHSSSANNRKRKYETTNKNDTASSFQLISESLEAKDGIHPMDPNCAEVYDMLTDNMGMKYKDNIQHSSLDELGDYVNDNGESLMHIAARMNSGPTVIKQLHTVSPSMLQCLDEWGRTPLASAIAANSVESTEQLITLEKQLRKESKQTKCRSGMNNFNAGVSCEYFVKKTTALIEAVKSNSQEIINLLLEEGNPVNVLDSYGRSVVHWAAIYNNVAVLERLSHMKIFQKLADFKDNEDKSPLYLAASEGALESVKFLLEYFNKASIRIDPNSPCPKQIAEEKGFIEIRDIINEALRKVSLTQKNEKRFKLKESKSRNKVSNFEKPSSELCMIEEYKELSANSIENFPNSPMGNESIDSCVLELYSLTDPSAQTSQEHLSNEKNMYRLFKPVDHRYQGYQSNTSSSDMSPPLLNLNNAQFQNGFNSMTYSDQLDSNFSNSVFMSPKSFINQPDPIMNPLNQMKSIDFSTEFYNYQTSPTLSEYKHQPLNVPNFPSLNCLL